MTSGIRTFTCPRCRRGEFRSLPGPDGRAFCPWCGDAVGDGRPSAPAAPAPSPEPAAEAPREAAPAVDVGRLAELERRCEQAEAELRRELEKKQEIKKAVTAEMTRLEAQLAEANVRLQRRDKEHFAALETLARMKESAEAKWAADLAALRQTLEEKETAARGLEARLEERRRTVDAIQEVLDGARSEAERHRSELEKLRRTGAAEQEELRRRLAAAEARLLDLKDSETEFLDLKARLHAERTGAEKEAGELRRQAAGLRTELEKRDQRVKELQLLVKTLGERLNDLSSRRF
jgi:chromosome segregation ATPase